VFEPSAGRVHYVYILPDVMVAQIEFKLTPEGGRTRVQATYDRTALTVAENRHVQEMADHDSRSGPEWQAQINAFLQTTANPG
jgi:hypothetical protein